MAPMLVVIVLFKLAISDGGRDPQSLTLAQVVIFVLLAIILWTGGVLRTAVTLPLVAIVATAVFTSFWSVRSEASLREILLWAMYLGITVIIASRLHGVSAATRFLDALVAIAGWLCLIALFMFWGAGNPSMRWYSTFYWPNPFAGFLLLTLPVELVRLAHAGSRRDLLAHGFLSVLLATSLVLTYSRGAWLSLLIVLPAMGVLLRPASRRDAAVRLVAVAVLITGAVGLLTRGAVLSPAGQTVSGRAASVADATDVSVQGRLNFWKAGVSIFRDHPWVGTGPGTFGAVHARYQRDVRFYARDPHSLYVQTFAEMGAIGGVALVAFLGMLGWAWSRSLVYYKGHDAYPIVCGAGLGVLAFLIHSAVEMNWAYPANPALMSALVGVLAWADRTRLSSDHHAVRLRVRGLQVAFGLVLIIPAVTAIVVYRAHTEFVLGVRETEQNRPAAALAHYRAAARLNPLSARYRARVAVVAAFLGQNDEADASWREAMRLDPMNASHPLDFSLMLTRSGNPERLEEIEALVRRAISLDPLNRPEAYGALAGVYVRQGRPAMAAATYRQAIGRYLGRGLSGTMPHLLLWPEVVRLALDASEFFVQQGNALEAERVLRAVLAEDPQSPALVAALAKLR